MISSAHALYSRSSKFLKTAYPGAGSTYLMILLSNCLAQRHWRMQLRQYVWQQLDRMPKRRSDGDAFSYTTSMQILHTFSWLCCTANACSMSFSNALIHTCRGRATSPNERNHSTSTAEAKKKNIYTHLRLKRLIN